MQHEKNVRYGFTLLEMSIVIAIIGLIIGGTVVGRDMIRASQLQSMLSEYDSYVKAITQFRDKYQALPGDMVGAQALWGTDPGGCPGTPANGVVPKLATCDGDGNGTIGGSQTNGAVSSMAEWYRAWQQLADAGMIPGIYTGLATGGGAYESTPGINVPASKVTPGGWTLLYQISANGDNNGLPFTGHQLDFGAFVSGSTTSAAVLTPLEAYNIDKKIDDGIPGTGTVRNRYGYPPEPNCMTNSASSPAPSNTSYIVTNPIAACAPIFLLGF